MAVGTECAWLESTMSPTFVWNKILDNTESDILHLIFDRHQCIALSLDHHDHLNMGGKMFQVIVTNLWPQSFPHGSHTLKVLLHSEQSNLGNQHVVKGLVSEGHLHHDRPEASSSYQYHHWHPKLTLTLILRHHHKSLDKVYQCKRPISW